MLFLLSFFTKTQSPQTYISISVFIKHLYASSTVHTIGSPLTLKEVLIKIGEEVFS